MLKRVGKFFVLLLVFAFVASVLVACGSGDYKGTYYAYKNGVKQENDWIKLEKDKWLDNEGASGRLEEKDGVLYGYVVFFGEEDVLFYGTVKDGAFEYTLEGETYYTYYTEKSKAQNKDSSLHGKTDEQGKTDTPTQPVKTQYTVTFDSKGGSDVASKRVNEGEKFTAPTQPTKTMYIFNGWYKESSCKNVWDFDTDVVTKDMTLYAKWQADEVRVTSVEGATIESNDITVIVNSGTNYVEMYDKVVLNSDTATWKLCSDILGKYEIRTKIATNDDGTLNSGDNLFYLIVSSADETQVKTYKLNIYKKYLVPVDVYDMYEKHIDAYTVYTTETLRAPSRSSFTGYVLNGWRSSEGKVGEPVPMYTYGIKLHPVATPNMYSVTLDPNGGTINTLSYTAKYDGSLYTEIPQKEGHSFLGWKYKGDYVSDNEGKCSAWKISSDATLVAEWQRNNYPVTVSVNDANAGSASVEGETLFGNTVTLVAETNAGYTFLGWYDGDTCKSTASRMNVKIPAKRTYYTAKWTYYTLTTNTNLSEAGTYTRKTEEKVTVGEEVTVTATTNNGYTWLGWYDGETKVSEGTSLNYTFTMGTENKTYTAKWSKITITRNDTSAGTISSLNGKYVVGDEVIVTASTNNGYTWLGWYDGETKVSEGTSLTYMFNMPAESKTYTAKWTYYTLTANGMLGNSFFSYEKVVSFDLNGASGSIPSQTIISTTGLTYPNIPTRDQYVFAGWYDNANCSGSSYDFSATVTENKTLYAKWISYTGQGIIPLNQNVSLYVYNKSSSLRYYAFVPLVSGNVTIYSTGSLDTYGYLFNSSKSQLRSDDDGGSGNNFSITYSVTAGTLYYISPCGYGSNGNTTVYISANMPSAGGVAEGNTEVGAGVAGTHTRKTEEKVTVGEEVTLTATTNNGYTWLGWYDGENKVSEGTSLTHTFNMPAENKTYTAKWYKIGIKKNISAAGTVSSLTDKYVVGDEVTVTATTNNGYTWLGWYDGETKVSEGTSLTYTFNMPAENKTYTAKWIVCPVTLEKNIDEAGSVTGVYGATIVGEETTLTATTNNGYTWLGWYDGETKVSEGTSLTYTFDMPAESKTYTAKWSKITITRNNTSAGTISSLNGKYVIGDEVTVTATTNNGYTWLGWYDGETKVSEGTSLTYTFNMPAENKTYTAKWSHYSVSYDLAGGVNGENPTYFETYASVITLNDPSKVTSETITNTESLGNGNYRVTIETTAYNFLGWYTESAFENEVTEITYTGSNVVLYAKWSETTSTSTFTTTESAYSCEGNYVYFGTYPQTQVTDSAIKSALASMAGTLPTSSNSQKWTSYGYYINGSVSNFMWYIDLTYNNEKYRGMYFTSYRPYYTTNSSSTSNSYQDDNGYNTSTVYWFKYEPIKWRILSEANGEALILCEMIIDSQEYYPSSSTSSFSHNGGTGYANNYALSNIRKWLNDTFYNTAFNDLQKALVQVTTVDNSARSTNPNNDATQWTSGNNQYACANTQDKVFLLSEQEVTNSAYGFNADYSNYDTARQKKNTDYAKCQGAWTSTDSSYLGNGYWWLRSPYGSESCNARYGSRYGHAYYSDCVYRTSFGVVPALKIRL